MEPTPTAPVKPTGNSPGVADLSDAVPGKADDQKNQVELGQAAGQPA